VIHSGCRGPPHRISAAGHPPVQNLTLSNLRGRPVTQAFYPADWSPVCGDQVTLYNEVPEFHKHKAELRGVSVDGV
jgi:peroxiredoxin